ncbi:zinc phosphodiesterase ELAC protein 1 isoform X1 [Brachyhypopomus gauderio]|uniref:zinc phosphodiesterase ELAC protein 1 isoform X1 n=1 Tax=Brachyhypopomus gauderio TaxID=698409 RepID=UPI0040419843
MSMDITFLGTGSAYPSPHRGASALVLRTEGECWLFDCGEGTQTQLMKSAIRASKITKVFISHLHGDHFFGLPGLLCTLSLSCSPHGDQEGPHIEVYGPQGLRNFLRVALQISRSDLLLTYAVHELEPSREQSPCTGHLDPALTTSSPQLHPQERPGRTVHLDPDSDCYSLVHDQRFVVQAFQLYHRVPSFGFAVQERERPGRLKVELLKELGVNPGPLYGRLKNGQSVTLDSGRLLRPEEVLEPAVRGRKVCVFGDCSALVGEGGRRACEGADVMVHEATLEDGQQEKAVEHGHSTPSMAAAVALACGARTLVLHHFSQRYRPAGDQQEQESGAVGDQQGGGGAPISQLKVQAEQALQGSCTRVILAEDFLTVPVVRQERHTQPGKNS